MRKDERDTAKNWMNNGHYTMPGLYHEAMTRKQVRETMLATDGQVLARGGLWDVVAKSLGGGVYRVTTKRVRA